MKKIIYLILGLVVGLFIFSPVQAQEKSWYFISWDIDIQINQDSTFVIKETQTFDFTGNFHWVKRDIAKRKLKRITDVKVFDEQGKELRFPDIEITEDSSQVSIKVNFDLTDRQAAWTFQYTVHGGIGYFEDHDELYWNAVSQDRDVKINSVKVIVHLPEEVEKSELKQRLFVGPYGATTESQNFSIVDKKTLEYRGQNIAPYENFTIVAGWPKGIVYQPGMVKIYSEPEGASIVIDGKKTIYRTPAILEEKEEIETGKHEITLTMRGHKETETKEVEIVEGKLYELNFTLEKTLLYQILPFIYLLIPILAFILLLRRWLRYGKDPKWKGTIIAQYEPPRTKTRLVQGRPDYIAPAEMGTLIREGVRNKDITSTLIDLAYRGYLKIFEEEKKRLFTRRTTYKIRKLKDYSQETTLRAHEKLFLDGLFGTSQEVTLDDLKNKFYREIPGIKRSLLQQVLNLGYFKESPDKIRIKYIGLGIGMAVAGGALFIFLPLLAFMVLLSGILCLAFAKAMPAKTKKGSSAAWQTWGFKEYLHTAERFRLDVCTPETFEKHLSYAMVFGVEKQWAARFVDIYKEQPDWYVSARPVAAFSVISFTDNLSSMTQTASAALTTSPARSASGVSGFGGGGFAGGGGGGGGSSAG